MPKNSHALTVLAAPELVAKNDDVAKLQQLAVAQVAAIGEMESNAAKGGILAGLTLHRVKASLPHGQFGKWIDQISTAVEICRTVKKSQANNYMRLAMVFVERMRVAKPNLLALPGDQTSLDLADNAAGQEFRAKLEKFCGGLSLNELLIKFHIKAVGLKTELTGTGSEEDEDLTPEQRAEQVREAAWLALWNPAQAIRATLTDPNKVQLLTADKFATLKAELAELNRLIAEVAPKNS